MPSYGKRSKAQIATASPKLQRLFQAVIPHRDHTILEGIRTEERQQQLWRQGREDKGSIVTWADGITSLSNHQRVDSVGKCLAVDAAPWYDEEPHIRWDDVEGFFLFAGYVLATADQLGIEVEWGGFWPGKKRDLPHWQVRE